MTARRAESEIKVTDRRLFTSEGHLREESPEAAVQVAEPDRMATATEVPVRQAEAIAETAVASGTEEMPAPPTVAEQKAQADAYRKSSKTMDSQAEQRGYSAKDLEMTFERFLASLYMTAMMQMGMMHEQGGQPRLDILGARQTVDTLSLLAEKTKGNLTAREAGFLENSLYELRMAYVEVTNALAHGPQVPPTTTPVAR